MPKARPDATLELTGRVTPGVQLESSKGPESDFVDRTRHRVRSVLRLVLFSRCVTGLSGSARDRTRRSNWPHPRRALLCHWLDAFGQTETAFGHYQWPPFASVSIHDDLEKISATDVVKNKHFISSKTSESHAHKLGRRERGPKTPLYRSNSTAFANVLTPPSVHHYVYVC
jgi:hypothetical protein